MYNKMKYCLILKHSNENGGIHMDKLLELLEQDCSMTTEQLATIAGMSEADVYPALSSSLDVELNVSVLTSTMPASGMRTVCFHPRWRRCWRDSGKTCLL